MPPDPVPVALAVCQALFDKGFVAYFAGGYVRDLLLGCHSMPLEIDIATNALPEQVESLFTKTVAVGKQFGVILVIEQGFSFEVTTFRKDQSYQDGRHPTGVDFSNAEQDALRRDFTINGLFYDPRTKEILDYVGGKEDLKQGIIRAIGEPYLRFQEDRLRMMRAVRFSARFSFPIEDSTKQAIKKEAHTLFPSVSKERIWQEFEKMAAFPHFDQALLQLAELGLLSTIFPSLHNVDMAPLLSSFSSFPVTTPTIIYLVQLFPKASIEEKLDLCRYLKLSNDEMKWVLFFDEADRLFEKKEVERVEWAYFYAQTKSQLYLQVKQAKLPFDERALFMQEQKRMQQELAPHIGRIRENRPLITSNDLLAKGIKPGKEMGELLAKAIRLSVNEDIHSKELLLSLLLNGK